MPVSKTTLVVITLLGFIGLGASSLRAKPHGYEGYQVVRVTVASRADLDTLLNLDNGTRGFQVWSEGVGIGMIDVRVSPGKKRELIESGLRYEVLVADLQEHLDARFIVPEGGGFFDALRTYDEVVAFMQDLALSYPNLATMISLGSSVEGRPLWALRITGGDGSQPGVMYHGAQHGSEPIGMFAIAYIAQYLLTNYESDPNVAELVDNVEWFLLPIMNPDGYERYSRLNAHGVDLNRNWDGPIGNAGGLFAFSEPETAALRDFFLSHSNVRVHIDFHGYVHLIMWPWGYTSDLSRDHWTFNQLGTEMQDRVFAVGGTPYDIGPVYTAIYPVKGGSIDYSYGELGIWAFVIELNYAKWAEPPETQGPYKDILPAALFLAEWISDCNGNGIPDMSDIETGTSTDCNDNAVPDECEYQGDCNGDGIWDICDLSHDAIQDCNGNAVPDDCDISSGTSNDCTNDGVPDECEADCNENGVADSCDVAIGASADCNGNGVPDECEADCNGNETEDSCDIMMGNSGDCDANGVPDECEDCNGNGLADVCDIADGTSADCDGSGIPDECEHQWFVDDDAPEGGGGTSWAAAFHDLQDALDAADVGDRVRVAGGTYRSDRSTGDRAATFQLISGVEMLGGFAGLGAPDPDMQDYVAYETILSGDLNGDDLAVSCTQHLPDCLSYGRLCIEGVCIIRENNSENSYRVVTASGVDATAVLDGFTITAGNANVGFYVNSTGGGIYNEGGDPTLENCTITGNYAWRYGGGIYNDGGAPTLSSCSITGNHSGVDGGGMWIRDSRSIITECIFTRNTSGGKGGAVYNMRSELMLSRCLLAENEASTGGAAIYNRFAMAVLEDCIFRSNRGGLSGGAIVNYESNPIVERCKFFANTTVSQSRGGGAMASYARSKPTVSNSLFVGNTSVQDGGAVFNDFYSDPTFVNCTFVRNSAQRRGGAMANYDTTPSVEGCIFWLNSDESGSTEFSQIYSDDSSGLYNPQITYSCIQGWTGALGGVGNNGLDPMFADAAGPDGIPGTADDDLRLLPGSPAINTGDPGFSPEPGAVDLDGVARVRGCRVDRGAYESPKPQWFGDFDNSDTFDLRDFAALQVCFDNAPSQPGWLDACLCTFDLDDDSLVDLPDLAAFEWIMTGP